MKECIPAVVGPTASGKTELALRWAREQNGEIVSVDSRQVYKHLSIGTAKPPGRWDEGIYRVQGIPYHLVDILDPRERFSAADFLRLADTVVREIRARGRTPIFCGGTGLYFRAWQRGLAPLPPADAAFRRRLHQTAGQKGRSALHEALRKVDPASAALIPANHITRVIRALEVHHLTGKAISQWHAEHQAAAAPARRDRLSPVAGIRWAPEDLDRRIEARCRDMIRRGLIEETQALLQAGYPADCPGLSGVGYPRAVEFLKGDLSEDDLLAGCVRDTRRYAKRQRTWFRNQMEVRWKKP